MLQLYVVLELLCEILELVVVLGLLLEILESFVVLGLAGGLYVWAGYCIIYLWVVSCENVIVLFQVFDQFVDGFLDSGVCGVPD